MGFDRLYVVHPTEQQVLGIAAYPSVGEIPEEVDMAVVVSPTDTVVQVVRECTEKGIKGVVIFSSGFAERGAGGKALEGEIVRIARRGGTRIIGPNCMGIYCPASRLTFFPDLPRESGPVGMICHSGSLSVMLTVAAKTHGIRFSKVVSCGNECDLNAADFLEYFGQDHETRIILAYLETVKDGRRFFQLSREISREKPIIIWKGGTTERGARAAASHTGALAVSYHIWKAATTQAGIISANSAEEMVDYLQAFYHLPIPQGRKVAIVSGPGGPAVAASDACIDAGLGLSDLSPHTKRRLAELIPSVGTSVDNPIDLGVGSDISPQWYGESIRALGEDEGVDMLLIIGGSRDPLSNKVVIETVREVRKPVVFANMPGRGSGPERPLSKSGLAVYPDGRRAAIALGMLVKYTRSKTCD
jgi:acyl-CoA synthetase (NDP forming)